MFGLENHSAIKFRTETQTDVTFLSQLYTSTRELEMAQVDWNPSQKEQFLTMQFEAQHQYYKTHYGDSDFMIIEMESQPIGRLYLQDRGDEIRIVDIALIPEKRAQGIGSEIITALQKSAAKEGKNLGIHVERFNPALSLYIRSGFIEAEDKGVYLFMVWQEKRG